MVEPVASPPVQVGLLLFPGFEPLDAVGPAQVFWALAYAGVLAGRTAPLPAAQVHLAAAAPGPVPAGHGLVVTPTTTFAACPPLDVLVVPGGGGRRGRDGEAWGVEYFSRHDPTLAFVQAQARSAGVVASVCTGTFVLAGAGLLAGRRAATHWAARDALVARMAERGEPFELVAERVVDDGDLVTAGGVASGIDLALHLVGRLLGDETRELVRRGIEMETPA
jgi:cyclohexyl-isocyanide hydratase